jgi:hypothetical protein
MDSPSVASRYIDWDIQAQDLYLYNIKYKKKTTMTSAGFEPQIPANKRPQAYAFDQAATCVISRRFINSTRCDTKGTAVYLLQICHN